MRETRILEFKEKITNTFLKTVSAFSNYDGGVILFGVDDDGNIKSCTLCTTECSLYIMQVLKTSSPPKPRPCEFFSVFF